MIEFPNALPPESLPTPSESKANVNSVTQLAQSNLNLQTPFNHQSRLLRNNSERNLLTPTITIKFPNGSEYKGVIKNNLPHGNGILTRFNKTFYIGDFVEGKRSGDGSTYRSDYSVNYKGQWKNDKPWGYGTAYSKTGKVIFEGEFEDGKAIIK